MEPVFLVANDVYPSPDKHQVSGTYCRTNPLPIVDQTHNYRLLSTRYNVPVTLPLRIIRVRIARKPHGLSNGLRTPEGPRFST